MFSDSFFFFPLNLFQCLSFSHVSLSHSYLSGVHWASVSPSLSSLTWDTAIRSHSRIKLHHVLYPLHVLCDIEHSGSSTAGPLMADYWCWVLIPLTHQHQTCSPVSTCVCMCVYIDIKYVIKGFRAPQRNLMIKKKHAHRLTNQRKKWSADGSEGSQLRDCTMTGPRSVVQQLYIAQHGRQEIDI